MTGWTTNNQKLRPDGGLNLLQNCDLPPPLKVFGGADKAVLSFMNRFWTITGQEDQNQAPLQMCTSDRYENNERKAARLIKEREAISNALLKEFAFVYVSSVG